MGCECGNSESSGRRNCGMGLGSKNLEDGFTVTEGQREDFVQ